MVLRLGKYRAEHLDICMRFKDFVKMLEGGGLFTTQGWQQTPGTARNAKDLYLHQYGAGGGGNMTSSIPVTGNQQPPPKRMKKMGK